ncbi:hypothetical protein EST38_g14646 [Candolleomyces aberdarensis]|uniref:Alcohol dehydrogenase-like N-terminal domain-containing protein n=1 Tax=Candolleomyces aberdarensis TaxID=2316362 RepID=A0A4Q2CXR9_9AGAR|nr:hypothetical protein EST38_g14646 [Candolleomyces aberdarensis]
MSTSTTQQALFLTERFGDFMVSTAPIYKPGKDEVLVKIYAAGLNPIDWKIRKYGVYVDTFPSVLGVDIAGEVIESGEGVSEFAKGDRVLFQGIFDQNNHTGFQQFTTADVRTLAKV